MKKMLMVLALLALSTVTASALTNACGQQQQGYEPPWQWQWQGHEQQMPQGGYYSSSNPNQYFSEFLSAASAQAGPCGQRQQWQGGHEQQTARKGYYGGGATQDLNQCGEFLRQQCNPLAMPFLQPRTSQPSSCKVLRKLCCRQLRQTEPQYRHQAIYDMLQSIMQQQQQPPPPCGSYGPHQQAAQGQMAMMTAAQYLPAMCGLPQPSYSSSPCSGVASGAVRY